MQYPQTPLQPEYCWLNLTMSVKFAVSYLAFEYLSQHVWQFLGRFPLSLQSTVGTVPCTDPRPLPLYHSTRYSPVSCRHSTGWFPKSPYMGRWCKSLHTIYLNTCCIWAPWALGQENDFWSLFFRQRHLGTLLKRKIQLIPMYGELNHLYSV